MTSVRKSLEVAITELSILMDDDDSGEQKFQSWFERHPIAWEVLGFQRFIPHPALSLPEENSMILDFLAERPDGLWEIVELKRPDTAIIKDPERRTTFYSKMNSYISQCHEYSLRCSDSAVMSDLLSSCGIRMNGWPHSLIIAGRSAGLDRVKVHELLRHLTPKIAHYTYDDILYELNQHHAIKSQDTTEPGLNIFFNVGLCTKTSDADEYIFDLGGAKDKGRVSVIRRSDDVINFIVINDDGLRFSQEIRLSRHCDKNAFSLGLRTVKTKNSSWIFIEINGSYVGQHEVAANSFTLEADTPFVLSADMNGTHAANMFAGQFIYVQRALSVVELSLTREYIFEELWPRDNRKKIYRLRFHKGRFLYSIGHPVLDINQSPSNDLIQRVPDLRPSLVNWISSSAEYTEVDGSRIGLINSRAHR
jgi:Domain of unknown function (DUF4263)